MTPTPHATPDMFGAGGSAPLEPVHLEWRRPDRMALLGAWHFLMRVVTIGLHQFWAKVEVRARLWSAVRLNGEPLIYSGRGSELFRGFLLTMGLVFVPLTLIGVGIDLMLADHPYAWLFAVLSYLPFLYLFFVGHFSAQRYRLSRTEWRGVRGNLEGSPWIYAWHCMWTAALIPLTLGLIWPWRSLFLHRKLVEGMRFGDRRFQFEAPWEPLYGPFVLLWLSCAAFVGAVAALMFRSRRIVSQAIHWILARAELSETEGTLIAVAVFIGVSILALVVTSLFGSWYQAFKDNYFARHTSFEGARFTSRLTGGGLAWQQLSNGLLVFLTLGLLTPVAQARMMGYRITRTALVGGVAIDEIIQPERPASRSGEGLAQLFEIDVT